MIFCVKNKDYYKILSDTLQLCKKILIKINSIDIFNCLKKI